ncbi:MAG: hypothetical protein ACM3ZV_13390 [Bacillota bacterium]
MPNSIERSYVEQGYSLPDRLDWDEVATLRRAWYIPQIFVPLAVGGGCIGWGVPYVRGMPLEHP